LIDTFRDRVHARVSSPDDDDFSALFGNAAEFNAAVKAAVREGVQAELGTVGDPTRGALFDLARRAVAAEFETSDSHTRAALIDLLSKEIESQSGDLHRAFKSVLAPGG
jgi:hypothetical protein